MSQLPISLEKPIGEDEDSSLGDFVPDDAAESPFDTASLYDARTSSLPSRHFPSESVASSSSVMGSTARSRARSRRSGAFGVTRERIRQIENNTLKKLEGLPEAQGLKDCV